MGDPQPVPPRFVDLCWLIPARFLYLPAAKTSPAAGLLRNNLRLAKFGAALSILCITFPPRLCPLPEGGGLCWDRGTSCESEVCLGRAVRSITNRFMRNGGRISGLNYAGHLRRPKMRQDHVYPGRGPNLNVKGGLSASSTRRVQSILQENFSRKLAVAEICFDRALRWARPYAKKPATFGSGRRLALARIASPFIRKLITPPERSSLTFHSGGTNSERATQRVMQV